MEDGAAQPLSIADLVGDSCAGVYLTNQLVPSRRDSADFMVCAAVDFLPPAARWRSRAGRILCYLCYALSSLMLIKYASGLGKARGALLAACRFYPFTGRYPGVDAHTLLLPGGG